MLDHFDEFSTVFGRDGAMLSVLLVVSLALTAFHVYQEWKGGAVPLWRVFGAIVGVRLPDRLGFLLFTVVLTLVLWALSVQGMTGWPLASKWSSFALGALIGARISDSIVSHWILYAMGYRPNPGLTSTPLYIAEAALLAYVFWEGLSLHPLGAWGGVAAGAVSSSLCCPPSGSLALSSPTGGARAGSGGQRSLTGPRASVVGRAELRSSVLSVGGGGAEA